MMDNRPTITSVSPDGEQHHFRLEEEEETNVNDFDSIRYRVFEEGKFAGLSFLFQIVFLENSRILAYMILNNNHEPVSGKGLVKALIKHVMSKYNTDLVSSTRLDHLKISEMEGRTSDAEKYWRRWSLNNPGKVKYLKEEDRYIWHI